MSNLENVEQLINVSHFTAPAVDNLTPHDLEDCTELIEIMTGGTIFFEDKEYHKGAIFWHITGEHTIHRTRAADPYRCMVFRFKMRENSKRAIPRASAWNNLNEMDVFFSQALRYYHGRQYKNIALTQYIYSRLYWEVVYQGNISSPELELPPSLQRAISFIEKGFYRELSVGDLARYARVSKPYLFALFSEHMAISPHKYINNCRINHARSLLAGSNKGIKEIAHECGFISIASFYRLFKQHHEISPAVYRNNNNPYRILSL